MKFSLPWPPSGNHRNAWGRGTTDRRPWQFPTKQYKNWKKSCMFVIPPAMFKSVDPGVKDIVLVLDYFRPDNRKRDLDNINKPIGDILQEAWEVDDYRFILVPGVCPDHRKGWKIDRKNPRVEISVETVQFAKTF